MQKFCCFECKNTITKKFCQGFWPCFLSKNMEGFSITYCFTINYFGLVLILEST